MSESTRFSCSVWEEALSEFLLHCQATRAKKTHYYYKVQLRQLVTWAVRNEVPFDSFGKRHLDRYLVYRAEGGRKPLTLHHDAICAKAFMAWCSKNDLLDRSLLAEYQVRNAPEPARYMPTQDEIDTLLQTIRDYWDVTKHPEVRYYDVHKRIFHRDRNHAIIQGLLDTACRVGELFNLQVDDYRAKERQVVIRVAKGREPRVLPVSATWAASVDGWLKVRARVMKDVKSEDDEGWLFISEYGGRVHEGRFLAAMKSYLKWANLPSSITLHSLRRFSINKLAKVSLLAAQQIAGHKETKTTLLYTKLDPEFLREAHEQAGVVAGNVLIPKRDKRKKLI